VDTPAHRWSGLAVATVVLGLCGAVPLPGERRLAVASASLQAKRAPDGHATALCKVEIEFTEAHLEALRDDEAMVEITVVDRDGHGGRRLLEDLEDCRLSSDGSMRCPRGVAFERVTGDASRWRLAIAFGSRSTAAAFRGPLAVRFAYSVSGGPETVHVGKVGSCVPAQGGPTVTCHAGRKA
jgi:hypothetical protein